MLLWGGLVLYYLVLGAIYWAVDGDAAGATLLLMATALGGLVAGWIWDWRPTTPTPPLDRRTGSRIGVAGAAAHSVASKCDIGLATTQRRIPVSATRALHAEPRQDLPWP